MLQIIATLYCLNCFICINNTASKSDFIVVVDFLFIVTPIVGV